MPTFFLGCFIWTRMEMINRTKTTPEDTPITVPWVLVIWWNRPLDLFSMGRRVGEEKKERI